jgi:hypothetical protein
VVEWFGVGRGRRENGNDLVGSGFVTRGMCFNVSTVCLISRFSGLYGLHRSSQDSRGRSWAAGKEGPDAWLSVGLL